MKNAQTKNYLSAPQSIRQLILVFARQNKRSFSLISVVHTSSNRHVIPHQSKRNILVSENECSTTIKFHRNKIDKVPQLLSLVNQRVFHKLVGLFDPGILRPLDDFIPQNDLIQSLLNGNINIYV